jgi:hypothetical protein
MTEPDAEELRLINAVIGFCKRMRRTWPRPLHSLGYEVCGVGWDVGILLEGQDRTVPADLICASVRLRHALCVEAKSSVVDEDQAKRYRAITKSGLLNSGAVPPRLDATRLTHDVVYLTAAQSATKIVSQLAAFGIAFPVVSAGLDRFVLTSGLIAQPDLRSVLDGGIEIDHLDWPTHFVPFTSRSSDGKIARFFCNALAALLRRGKPFGIDDVAALAVPHWKLCGSREKKDLRKRLRDLMRQGHLGELRGYYTQTQEGGKPVVWTPTSTGLVPPHDTRRLALRIAEFRSRVGSGKRYEEPPIQMPLFVFGAQDSQAPPGDEGDVDWEADDPVEP